MLEYGFKTLRLRHWRWQMPDTFISLNGDLWKLHQGAAM